MNDDSTEAVSVLPEKVPLIPTVSIYDYTPAPEDVAQALGYTNG